MPTTPTLTTTVASPNVALSNAAVTLKDSATLSGGSNPTGTITYQLLSPLNTVVFTDTEVVNGNGTYSTPVGYVLPSNGAAVVGTYSWHVNYNGDLNNNAVTASAEQATVSAASPSLSTTASAGGLAGTVLKDTAHLSGAYFPSGTITFQLFSPQNTSLFLDTERVNGDGTYSTPGGFIVPNGAAAGTYSWTATYSGDGNNSAVTASSENVIVGPQVDLSVTITGSAAIAAGTTDTYTITVGNNGPSTVNSLTLTDSIPAALLGASFTPSVGAYDPASGAWSGLSLASGQSVSILLSGLIDPNATGTIVDSVTVSAPAGVPENNPANNVATVFQTLTAFTPNASPPAGTTADMILRGSNTSSFAGRYEIYDIGNNAILAASSLGQVETDFQVAGLGGFFGNDTSDMMLRNSKTGGFEIYDIGNNNVTNAAALGAVGLTVAVAGFGDFSGRPGETDMLLRNTNTGEFVVYDISNNQVTSATSLGAVGLQEQVLGFGDFSGKANETDMLLRDSSTGMVTLYEISNNQVTSATALGAIGSQVQFAGAGDFSSRPGETDMLMRDSHTGNLEVYDFQNGTITSATSLGAVGLQWTVAGFGDLSGNANETDMMMRTDTGAFTIYDISNNQVSGVHSIGAVGLTWTVAGIANDPPNAGGPSSGATIAPDNVPGLGSNAFSIADTSIASGQGFDAGSNLIAETVPLSSLAMPNLLQNHT